jgi:hypothetical protein
LNQVLNPLYYKLFGEGAGKVTGDFYCETNYSRRDEIISIVFVIILKVLNRASSLQ